MSITAVDWTLVSDVLQNMNRLGHTSAGHAATNGKKFGFVFKSILFIYLSMPEIEHLKVGHCLEQ